MALTKIETIYAQECAKLFGISEGSIYRLARNGELTKESVYRPNGRHFSILKDDKFRNQLKFYQIKKSLKSKKKGGK